MAGILCCCFRKKEKEKPRPDASDEYFDPIGQTSGQMSASGEVAGGEVADGRNDSSSLSSMSTVGVSALYVPLL